MSNKVWKVSQECCMFGKWGSLVQLSILESCDCVMQYVKEISNMLSVRYLALHCVQKTVTQ